MLRSFTLILLGWLCAVMSARSQSLSDGFSVAPIPDSVWLAMQGKSYQPNADIGRDDLRYLRLRHVDAEGREHTGEMVCHRAIAQKLIAIFRELYRARYPIQQMRLPDVYDANDERQMRANNTSAFCYRRIAGSKRLSCHARGLAVDINPLYNPQVKTRRDGSLRVLPASARAFSDRTKQFPYKIVAGDLCHRLFLKHGFTWGGAWRSSKDYQHFEYRH